MTATTTQPKSFALTAEQVKQYHEQGYLGPFAAFSEQEMTQDLCPQIERTLKTDPPDHKHLDHNRHLDSAVVHRVATAPAVVDRMASIMGPDLLLWRTNFFVKEPGGKEIPWHQDLNYWPIEPPVVISAWMAIDPVTIENSCVQLIPGTHRKVIPHVKSTGDKLFAEEADGSSVDTTQLINMELKPGEFFLFNERTLHHSEPNRSQMRRIGLSIRVVPPLVRVLKQDAPNHGTVLIRGQDTLNFNPRAQPPQC